MVPVIIDILEPNRFRIAALMVEIPGNFAGRKDICTLRRGHFIRLRYRACRGKTGARCAVVKEIAVFHGTGTVKAAIDPAGISRIASRDSHFTAVPRVPDTAAAGRIIRGRCACAAILTHDPVCIVAASGSRHLAGVEAVIHSADFVCAVSHSADDSAGIGFCRDCSAVGGTLDHRSTLQSCGNTARNGARCRNAAGIGAVLNRRVFRGGTNDTANKITAICSRSGMLERIFRV